MDKGHTVAKFDQILLPKIPFYISQLILSNGPKYLGNLKKSSNRVSVFRAIIYRPFGMLHLENCFQTFWHRSKAFSKLMYNFCATKGKKLVHILFHPFWEIAIRTKIQKPKKYFVYTVDSGINISPTVVY